MCVCVKERERKRGRDGWREGGREGRERERFIPKCHVWLGFCIFVLAVSDGAMAPYVLD